MYLIETDAAYWSSFLPRSSTDQLFFLLSQEGRARYHNGFNRWSTVVMFLYKHHYESLNEADRNYAALRLITTADKTIQSTRGETFALVPLHSMRHPLVYRYAKSLLKDERLHVFTRSTAESLVLHYEEMGPRTRGGGFEDE